jgi:nicotinamide-nucleotide amidase
MYRRRGTQITEVNRRQAEIPEKGIALRNDHGTAPGIWIEEGEKVAVILPGVPFEMKAIMIEEVIPLIEKKRNKNQVVIHKEIVTAGIGESALSDLIESWELALPGHITLAYLPTPGKLMLRLTGRGNKAEKELLDQELEQQLDLLIQLVPQYIISTKNESIVEVISKKIIKKGQKLAVAESCTGGFLAHQITLLPGASRFFEGGIVSYSNTIKREILNVREINLKKHGAVSEFVVIDMAMNTMNLFDVDYAIAISGIVGPTGGTPEKPVGTAWIAVASPTKTVTQQVNYGTQGGREVIIQRIAGAALYLLYQQLQ